MRISTAVVGVAAFFMLGAPLLFSGASADDRTTCDQFKGYDKIAERIAACTRIIQDRRTPAKTRAMAYENRGDAYFWNGRIPDYDRAILDYDEAIRLEPKWAEAFDDRGNAFSKKNDFSRAIRDYNEAIRLDLRTADVFADRGDAYYHLKDYDRAIADYDDAIRLNPYSHALEGRRAVWFAKGDYENIIAEYSEIIGASPKNADAYVSRGIFQLYSDHLAEALADISQATELAPKNAYNALWLDIAGQRNNIQSRLSQSISQIDMTAWPAPVIRMFLGQLTPAAVLAAADDPKPEKKNNQVCEANFYTGELALRQRGKDEAIRLFRLAASDCPHNFLEWYAANAELKALGVEP